MDISKRLKNFLYLKQVKVSRFESEIGFSNGYVNSITRSIGDHKLAKIVERFPELNIEWLLLGKGEMLKSSVPDSALVNEPETPYTNISAKLEEARERILTLQEKLIDARDRFLDVGKEISHIKDDFIAAQKEVLKSKNEILELMNQNYVLENKYNSLKESILSKNIYNMLSDSEFFKAAKENFNHVPIDLALMFMWGSLFI